MKTDPVRAGITEKWPVIRLAEKWSFGQKFILSQKSPKFPKRLISILEKGTFFVQLFPVLARTWLDLRSESFFLGQKSRFPPLLSFVLLFCLLNRFLYSYHHFPNHHSNLQEMTAVLALAFLMTFRAPGAF